MMALSDGLAAALPRPLDASRRGVRLHASSIPLSPAARNTPHPLHHALCDGEEFELLFTVSPKNRARFAAAWKRAFPNLPAVCIGEILADPNRRCLHFPGGPAVPLQAGGYQHFFRHEPRAADA